MERGMDLSKRPVSRTALSWLLILQLAVLLPLALNLPAWLLLVALGCWGWRWAMFQGRLSPPNRWARAGLVLLCIGLVVLLEGQVASLRGFALLLAFGFIFKLVELKNLRDAYAVLMVAALLLAVNLLLSQTLITTGLTGGSLFFWLGAWVGLNQIDPKLNWRQSLKWAGALYLLALPLTVALFILVPRIPPIWQISTDSGRAQTGLSDSIAPGDIAQLARSDALAFRVSFEGERPSQQALYWRTVVMTGFDGRRWWQENEYWFNQQGFEVQGWARPLREQHSRWISWLDAPKPWAQIDEAERSYQVILEPTQQHWLPALAKPRSRTSDVGLVADQRLIYRYPIQQRLQYQVHSQPKLLGLAQEQELMSTHRHRYLSYPPQANPRMQQFATQLALGYPEREAFVQAFMEQVYTQPYVYTLEPPLLGEHAVDEFWFESRRGFCAHYASALALALRVVGIPSRIIGGYQGGEWDEEAQFLQVRQYDAHAWVEYWEPELGWVQVDPTAAVAPHRIESSFAQTLRAGQTQGGEAILSWRLSRSGWLGQLRSRWDRLEYLWHKRVLNYKAEQQYELLKSWFGEVNWRYLMVGLVLGISLFLGVITLWQVKPWQRSSKPAEVRLYQKLIQALEKYQITIAPSCSPTELHEQLQALPIEKRAQIESFIAIFEAISYDNNSSEATYSSDLQRMKQILKQL